MLSGDNQVPLAEKEGHRVWSQPTRQSCSTEIEPSSHWIDSFSFESAPPCKSPLTYVGKKKGHFSQASAVTTRFYGFKVTRAVPDFSNMRGSAEQEKA